MHDTMMTLSPSNPLTFTKRLLCVEPELYQAVKDGEDALEQFAHSFDQLLEDIRMAGPSLDDDTAILAHNVASRVKLISEGFHRLEVRQDELAMEAVQECDAICLEYSASHPGYVLNISMLHALTLSLFSSNGSKNKQFEACYRWLINNLHNPYPSAKTKQSIADASNAPLVNVDNWFLRARPRIGWNKLRKERFENNTPRMLAAAHQYFVEDKSSPHVRPGPSFQPIRKPLTESLNLAFSEIEMKAKHMYKDRYHTSEEMIAAASKSKPRAPHPYKDALTSRSKSRRSSTAGTSTTQRSSRSPSVTELSSTTAPSAKRKRTPEDAVTEVAKCSKYALHEISSSLILTM
jgi:hypothetical protein